MEELEKASCIRGFHVYQDNWTPILGERLVCKNEPGPEPGPLSAILIQETPYNKKEKNCWKTFVIGG